MKKIFIILVLCLTFLGCGSSDDDKDTITKITSLDQLEELDGVVWELPEPLLNFGADKGYLKIVSIDEEKNNYKYNFYFGYIDNNEICYYKTELNASIDSKGLIYKYYKESNWYSTFSISSKGELVYIAYVCSLYGLNNCAVSEKVYIPRALEYFQGSTIDDNLCPVEADNTIIQ